MPFLKLKNKFDPRVFSDFDDMGYQSYKNNEFFRCPYITSVWDEIYTIGYEAPLFTYVRESNGKIEDINNFVFNIRISMANGEERNLDDYKNEPKKFSQRLICFVVDKNAIGHEIDPDIEEILYQKPDIFVDKTGVIWIAEAGKKIYASLDLCDVISIDSEYISKETGISIKEILDVSVKNEKSFSVQVVDSMNNLLICELSLNANLINFKNSKIKVKIK